MASRNVLVMNSGSLQDQAFADASAVTPGVLSAFDTEGNLLALDDGADGDTLQSTLKAQPSILVLGHAELPRLTRVLEPSRIASVTKRAYQAPAKQVTTVSDLTSVDGGEFELKVMDLTLGREQFPRFSFNGILPAGATAAANAAQIRDAVNANPRAAKVVVASVSGSNLVLTAKDFDTSFTTAVSGSIVDATVTGTTAPSRGSGTAAHIALLEESAGPVMFGEYYVDCGLLGRKEDLPTSADPSKTYTVYVIRYENSIHEGLNSAFRYEDIYLCVATSGVTGDLDGFLEPTV